MNEGQKDTGNEKGKGYGSVVIVLSFIFLTAYWFGVLKWMVSQQSQLTLIIVSFISSITTTLLLIFGFLTRPKGGWPPHSVWGPMMVVLGFASAFFCLMTQIKLL